MITVVAIFEAKPDCLDKFIRLAADCAREAKKENGNLSYKVYQGRQNPSKFTFIEEWTNDTAIEKHNNMPYFKQFLEDTVSVTIGAPSIEQIMKVPTIR